MQLKRTLAVAALALGAVTPSFAADPIKIGLVLPMSGPFAAYGKQIEHGVKLYLAQNGDTIAGRKVELILKDDSPGTAGDVSKRLAQELVVKDKVDILAGFGLTPSALAVAPVSAEAKIPMVVMNAATSIITTKSPYIVRTSLTTPQNCDVLGTWAFNNGVKKVVTLVSDYGPGHDAEAAFQSAFKTAGGEIVDTIRVPMANPDFSAFVQRAKDSGADGIFIFIPGGSQPAALAKAMIERGMDPGKIRIMGQGELTDESALKAMGDDAIGIVTAFHYDYTHDSALNQKFVAAYNADFHRNPDIFSVGGYDGMHLIYEALKKTGGKADGDSLVDAAKGMAWESPRGPISIDPKTRDIINTVYIRRVEKVNGHVQNVEIAKVANVKDPVKARMK